MIGRTQLAEVEEHLTNSDDEAESLREKSLSEINDELEIRRIIDEIDNSCDAKNWQKCRSYFTDEIEVDFTSLSGGEPGKMAADDLIEAWETNLYEAKKSFHQRTNHLIKINGDTAQAFSKAYAFNLLESGEAAGLWEVWGNYTHTLERTEKGWKCSAMKLDVIHQRGDEKVRNYKPEK